MSEAEKRSVHTDALATLGSVIGESEKRDAIHIAVEPVTAAQVLYPGQDVGRRDDGFGQSDSPVGIVDPFLKGPVYPGQKFWLLIYPRQITSLRHVWAHPAFDCAIEAPKPIDPVSESKAWIEAFAGRLDQTPSRLMTAASEWLEDSDSDYPSNWTYDNSETYKEYYDQFPEFWKHYSTVTGTEVPEKMRQSFFTCSC